MADLARGIARPLGRVPSRSGGSPPAPRPLPINSGGGAESPRSLNLRPASPAPAGAAVEEGTGASCRGERPPAGAAPLPGPRPWVSLSVLALRSGGGTRLGPPIPCATVRGMHGYGGPDGAPAQGRPATGGPAGRASEAGRPLNDAPVRDREEPPRRLLPPPPGPWTPAPFPARAQMGGSGRGGRGAAQGERSVPHPKMMAQPVPPPNAAGPEAACPPKGTLLSPPRPFPVPPQSPLSLTSASQAPPQHRGSGVPPGPCWGHPEAALHCAGRERPPVCTGARPPCRGEDLGKLVGGGEQQHEPELLQRPQERPRNPPGRLCWWLAGEELQPSNSAALPGGGTVSNVSIVGQCQLHGCPLLCEAVTADLGSRSASILLSCWATPFLSRGCLPCSCLVSKCPARLKCLKAEGKVLGEYRPSVVCGAGAAKAGFEQAV
ncbi:basic proline-rich protein-like [Pogoniulus pusillus]|uniref:basic proline-rich protein-like n=1 Tax=Pogoniulus pusillus TaxID=488313 RepID=UPI0030B97BF7